MQARQPADRLLDRKRNLTLDLFGRERRGDRVDLNLNRSRVRERVNVELLEREHTNASEQQRGQDDQGAVLEREINEVVKHPCNPLFGDAVAACTKVVLEKLCPQHVAAVSRDHFAR